MLVVLAALMNKLAFTGALPLLFITILMKQVPQSSRRKFLRRSSMALSLTLAAPSLVPASALGRSGATAPSERINMGFIGLGGQESGHLLG
jgi:hypothetical protein